MAFADENYEETVSNKTLLVWFSLIILWFAAIASGAGYLFGAAVLIILVAWPIALVGSSYSPVLFALLLFCGLTWIVISGFRSRNQILIGGAGSIIICVVGAVLSWVILP